MKKKYTSYDQLPLMLNAEDVQNVLGLSRAKTYQIMHSADFPLELYGKRMLVTKDKFLDWLENRAVHHIFQILIVSPEQILITARHPVGRGDQTFPLRVIARSSDNQLCRLFEIVVSCHFCNTSKKYLLKN